MCNTGGRGSARDLFDFVGFRPSLNLPVLAKIDFAVLLGGGGRELDLALSERLRDFLVPLPYLIHH
jgi:hypothetical protein